MFFVHKHGSSAAPQSGYERVSRYRDPATGAIWVLWRTDKAEADVRAELAGDLLVIGSDPDADVLAVYPELLEHKRSRIRAEGGIRLTDVAGGYSAEERETWPQQVEEARRYQSTSDAGQCPMLSAFASGRGIDVALLAQGILDNEASFKAAAGVIMGEMYALLDSIAVAPDLAAALDVDWL